MGVGSKTHNFNHSTYEICMLLWVSRCSTNSKLNFKSLFLEDFPGRSTEIVTEWVLNKIMKKLLDLLPESAGKSEELIVQPLPNRPYTWVHVCVYVCVYLCTWLYTLTISLFPLFLLLFASFTLCRIYSQAINFCFFSFFWDSFFFFFLCNLLFWLRNNLLFCSEDISVWQGESMGASTRPWAL